MLSFIFLPLSLLVIFLSFFLFFWYCEVSQQESLLFSTKPLVGGLWFAISSFRKTTGFTLAVILLKGILLSLSPFPPLYLYVTFMQDNWNNNVSFYGAVRLEVVLLLVVYLAYGYNDGGAVAYILLSVSSWFMSLSWLFAPYLFNPSGFEWQK